MDRERRRELKAWGKAEVARQSLAIRAALKEANAAEFGEGWGQGHLRATRREKWLRQHLPVLRKELLEQLFVVHPHGGTTWSPHLSGYVMCTKCGSASPSAIRRKLLYWASCRCGNIRWRHVLWWRRCKVKDPTLVVPVKLIGRA